MRKRFGSVGLGVGIVALVVLGTAAPALALNTGPKSCPSPRTVFTASNSAGTVQHTQNGVVREWANGLTIQNRFWNRGLGSVSSSSVTSTLLLLPITNPGSRNYVSCQL